MVNNRSLEFTFRFCQKSRSSQRVKASRRNDVDKEEKEIEWVVELFVEHSWPLAGG